MRPAAPASAEPLSCVRSLYRVRGACGLLPIRKLLLATVFVIIGASTGGCSFRLGNMLAKNLAYFAKADAAGIVLGARVPIVLTSRADSLRARMASCAVATLYAHARGRRATSAAA